ncbi:MAG: type II toxin-antitoxin system VapC family toxin [Acidobacteria bacterium]|nr:type II toxin-antitoxin system VapC family toxin [Acidobacteriota bacterium]
MGLILDTNALSAIAEGQPAAAQRFVRASQVAIPVIVLGEYHFGIARSRHHHEYERWLEDMVSVSRVLDVDEETAIWYARLCGQLKEAGTPIPSNDAWIAALCRQHALPLLSRDRHFDLVKGVQRLDW